MTPCIRDLSCFKKKGCPQRGSNIEGGCPCWVDTIRFTPDGKEVRITECIDLYNVRLLNDNNCLIEGLIKTMEGFRNGMLEKDQQGNITPKPSTADVAVAYLLQDISRQQKQQIEDQNGKTFIEVKDVDQKN